MLIVEGTHYVRREEELVLLPQLEKGYVDCLLCDRLDSTALGNKRKSNNYGKGYRLDRLMAHYQSMHKDDLIDEGGRTIFDMGFGRGAPATSASNEAASTGQHLVGSEHTTPSCEWTGSYPWSPNLCCYRWKAYARGWRWLLESVHATCWHYH